MSGNKGGAGEGGRLPSKRRLCYSPLKNHPTPPLIAFLLLGTLGFPLGASVLIGGLADWLRADLSEGWPTATARILHSEAMMRLGKGPRHYPDISYDYEVAGKRYTSSSIRFSGAHFRTNDGAQQVVDRYPAGSDVMVRYDPDNPATAVLESSPAGAYQSHLAGRHLCAASLPRLLPGLPRHAERLSGARVRLRAQTPAC